MLLKKTVLFAMVASVGVATGALAECTFYCVDPEASIMIEENVVGQTDPVQYCVYVPKSNRVYMLYTNSGSGVTDLCTEEEHGINTA